MSHLLAEFEIDAAIDEFLRARGAGGPQPIVQILDDMPLDLGEENERWNAAYKKSLEMSPSPDQKTFTERMLDRMGT